MTPESITLPFNNILAWLNSFSHAVCLSSNNYHDAYTEFDLLIGAGLENSINPKSNALDQLKDFYDQHKNWMFGLLSYDLKNELENLSSNKVDHLNFPLLYFFVPQFVIGIKNDKISVLKGKESIIEEISQFKISKVYTENTNSEGITLEARMTKEIYLEQVNYLKEHINRGDIYEVTFCQEFFNNDAIINPLQTFLKLNNSSTAPFSCFFKLKDKFIISASPERYLAKRDQKIISQPIKGTAKRHNDEAIDHKIKNQLKYNPKELAENVMIVDLVRNDLTKCAKPNTVKVEELFGLYSFTHVHQLISTVSCELDKDLHLVDAIKCSFPMGSMTGAPKIRAMELIERYEKSKRGAFSGSIGWINPKGDFDFNVLIRSIFYNETTKYLSIQVGGAITDLSNPEEEFQETLVKAEALLNILTEPRDSKYFE